MAKSRTNSSCSILEFQLDTCQKLTSFGGSLVHWLMLLAMLSFKTKLNIWTLLSALFIRFPWEMNYRYKFQWKCILDIFIFVRKLLIFMMIFCFRILLKSIIWSAEVWNGRKQTGLHAKIFRVSQKKIFWELP